MDVLAAYHDVREGGRTPCPGDEAQPASAGPRKMPPRIELRAPRSGVRMGGGNEIPGDRCDPAARAVYTYARMRERGGGVQV